MSLPVLLPSPGRPMHGRFRASKERVCLTPDAIRQQLTKILTSQGFAHAARMRRFLEFIVEEALAGRAYQLCEYTIGTYVFERDESFEPGLDPIVRNDARRLRQKLLEYYHLEPRPRDDQIIIELPKGGYVPLFRAPSKPEPISGQGTFRLVAKLICVETGVELWNAEHDFRLNEQSDKPCLALQFQVRRHRGKLHPLRT